MKANTTGPTCWRLFLNCLALSAFTVGGGYVMIPLMKERFSDRLGWITHDELTELTALGQSAPGAMVINTCSLMGYRLLGLKGAVCAALGTALPAIVALIIISLFYELIRDNVYVAAAFRGMRAGVAAVIADTVVTMAAPYFRRDRVLYAVIMCAAFLIAFLLDINVGIIIAVCAVLGIVIGAVQRRRGAEK